MAALLPRNTECGLSITRHSLPEDEWGEWTAKVKADLGFMAENHLHSPVIWSKVGGRYIGGCNELQQLALSKFGTQTTH